MQVIATHIFIDRGLEKRKRFRFISTCTRAYTISGFFLHNQWWRIMIKATIVIGTINQRECMWTVNGKSVLAHACCLQAKKWRSHHRRRRLSSHSSLHSGIDSPLRMRSSFSIAWSPKSQVIQFHSVTSSPIYRLWLYMRFYMLFQHSIRFATYVHACLKMRFLVRSFLSLNFSTFFKRK